MNERIILYSTGCPRCEVLKKKLDEKGVSYEIVTDTDEMLKLGMTAAPGLSVDGGLMDFSAAIRWVNQL